MKKVLTIAGSDCSGGAGIQADIKTIAVHKIYAMSAITALTAQNTTGVTDILEVEPEFLKAQLDAIFTDIRPDAVKVGMVSSGKLIEAIVDKLIEYKAENIVVDPLMIATSGAKLLSDEDMETLKFKLISIADIITPNILEAEVLSGLTIRNQSDMVLAAREISEFYPGYILIKGGHLASDAVDLLYKLGEEHWFSGKKIDNPNTHGTGCTLSSAIACNLALGNNVPVSVSNAKEYITGAIAARLDLGKGSGPLDHTYNL